MSLLISGEKTSYKKIRRRSNEKEKLWYKKNFQGFVYSSFSIHLLSGMYGNRISGNRNTWYMQDHKS